MANGVLALPALRLARLRSPVVWIVHDVLLRRDLIRVVRSCSAMIVLAIAPSESAASQPAVQGIDTRIVRHGTTWPVAPAPTNVPSLVVGLAGVLTPWKGQDVLLDAAARLPAEVTVELMGAAFPKDQDYELRLRQRAARRDLAGRVRFLGYCNDPLERMRTWRVAVSASVAPEAAGLSVIEAMRAGVPVVATDHGGPHEWLDGAGLLVPPGDATTLADAIERLLGDRELHDRCAAAGPAVVAAEFALERQLGALFEAVTSVAGAGPGTG